MRAKDRAALVTRALHVQCMRICTCVCTISQIQIHARSNISVAYSCSNSRGQKPSLRMGPKPRCARPRVRAGTLLLGVEQTVWKSTRLVLAAAHFVACPAGGTLLVVAVHALCTIVKAVGAARSTEGCSADGPARALVCGGRGGCGRCGGCGGCGGQEGSGSSCKGSTWRLETGRGPRESVKAAHHQICVDGLGWWDGLATATFKQPSKRL